MSKAKPTQGTLATGERVTIPEDQFDEVPPGATAVALRGVRFSQAVMFEGRCLGWILAEDLRA